MNFRAADELPEYPRHHTKALEPKIGLWKDHGVRSSENMRTQHLTLKSQSLAS